MKNNKETSCSTFCFNTNFQRLLSAGTGMPCMYANSVMGKLKILAYNLPVVIVVLLFFFFCFLVGVYVLICFYFLLCFFFLLFCLFVCFFLLYLWQSPYNVQSPVEAAKLIGKILTKNNNNLIPYKVSSWDQNYVCNILQTWCHGTVLLVEIMNLKGFDNQGVRHCMRVWSWARDVQRHLCQSFFDCCCCCCFWFCVCVWFFIFVVQLTAVIFLW